MDDDTPDPDIRVAVSDKVHSALSLLVISFAGQPDKEPTDADFPYNGVGPFDIHYLNPADNPNKSAAAMKK